MKTYETPEILLAIIDNNDVISTSNGFNLPDVPLNSHREDEEFL